MRYLNSKHISVHKNINFLINLVVVGSISNRGMIIFFFYANKSVKLLNNFYISFTLYPAHYKVGRYLET